MRLLYGRRLRELAEHVEREIYRLERESRWRSALLNGLIAGVAVGLVAWIVAAVEQSYLELRPADLVLFACLGSSSASIVFAPIQKSNSLRSIILAYGAAALVCIVLYLVRDALAARDNLFPVPLQCGAAVALCVVLMRALDAMHPAAVGSAMAFVIFRRDLLSLLLLILAIVVLIAVVKVLAYVYREELTFKQFPCEFRRSYYGIEMRLMMREPSAKPGRDASPDEADEVTVAAESITLTRKQE